VVELSDIRAATEGLPRSYEVIVRDRIKFRVGRIVYLALSQDEATLGFAFPKEERAALVAAEPDRFFLPQASDLRFQWACAHLERLGDDELRDLIVDSWRMVVPKRVYAQWSDAQ
jgi:hypothetical protein